MDSSTKVTLGTLALLLAPGGVVLVIAKTAGASWLFSAVLGSGAVAATAAMFSKKTGA